MQRSLYPESSNGDFDSIVAAINRKLFYRIFDPIALYRVIYDDNGNPTKVVFLDVNPAYERVMGVKRKQVVGHTFAEVWPCAEKEWHQLVIDVAHSGRSKHHEGESRDTGKYLYGLGFTESGSCSLSRHDLEGRKSTSKSVPATSYRELGPV